MLLRNVRYPHGVIFLERFNRMHTVSIQKQKRVFILRISGTNGRYFTEFVYTVEPRLNF